MPRLFSRPAGGQLRLDLERAPSYARADFIVSSSNAAAVAMLDAWPNWPGGKLVLVGPEGSGKTHLAHAWAASVEALTRSADEARPMLIEDADRHGSEESLFHLLNRADTGDSLLITSRTAPSTWSTSLPDLRSRLNALTVVNIGPADDALLLSVIQKLFSERNIRPRSDLGPYVIRRIERSVAAAREFVLAIDELAAVEKREVNIGLARRLFEGHNRT